VAQQVNTGSERGEFIAPAIDLDFRFQDSGLVKTACGSGRAFYLAQNKNADQPPATADGSAVML
jgi:hypothetical protein